MIEKTQKEKEKKKKSLRNSVWQHKAKVTSTIHIEHKMAMISIQRSTPIQIATRKRGPILEVFYKSH